MEDREDETEGRTGHQKVLFIELISRNKSSKKSIGTPLRVSSTPIIAKTVPVIDNVVYTESLRQRVNLIRVLNLVIDVVEIYLGRIDDSKQV